MRRSELEGLRRRVDSLKDHAERVAQENAELKDRLEAEYEKHTPRLSVSRLRLGDHLPQRESVFVCVECHGSFWPCQAWHMLRRIYWPAGAGGDVELRFVPRKKGVPL